MKSNKISNYFIVVLFFITYSLSTTAQTKKIGIVFDADTSLIHQYAGITIFENSEKPLSLDVEIEKYIKDRLVDYLTPQYIVEVCKLPDNLRNLNPGFFDSYMHKNVKKWASTQNNKYDIIFFVQNSNQTFRSNSKLRASKTGVYTELKGGVYIYSTITYRIYDTKTSKIKGYVWQNEDFLYQLKGVKFSKNQKKQDPELLPFFATELKKYLSEKIEFVLVKSKLMTSEEILAKADVIYKDSSLPKPRPLPKEVDDPFKDDIY